MFHRIRRLFSAVTLGSTALAVATAGTVTTIVPQPAEADHCGYVSPDDDGLTNLPSGCRNDIVQMGVGERLDRQGLLQHADVYLGSGFTYNYLWYAPETTTTVVDENMYWSSCTFTPTVGTSCTADSVQFRAPILDLFHAPSVTLSSFSYRDTVVFKGCGNFTRPTHAKPIPTIISSKFHDVNRNGQRDGGEPGLGGWQFDLVRLHSEVGVNQPPGYVTSTTSTPNGDISIALDGIGPGRYRLVEVGQAGWRSTTPASIDFDVHFGIGDLPVDVPAFGNTETQVDVAKTSFAVVNAPTETAVRTDTTIDVQVRLENLGPALEVNAVDEVVAIGLPTDCVINDRRRTISARLRRGEPVVRTVSYIVNCERPSFHQFDFEDTLLLDEPTVTEINDLNNHATTSVTIPVIARTDLATTSSLVCSGSTIVAAMATCTATVNVTNNGYGPIDATSITKLTVPADCVEPPIQTSNHAAIADGGQKTVTVEFDVTCSHRSFHEFSVSTAVAADDIHVIDTNATNNAQGSEKWTMEVFHDATLTAADAYIYCNETAGAMTFTCTAEIDVVNEGPAPDVASIVSVELSRSEDCLAAPTRVQTRDLVLAIGDPEHVTFTWNMTCPAGWVLHPFRVAADVAPNVALEPHAMDTPGPIVDDFVVPYCLPTVNPHGAREPQAPGTGMNEDGFYVFGTLPNELGKTVTIRDGGTGFVYGQFPIGTRVKYVEANGATPSLSPMAGNNGNGKGAIAVDYRIQGQGDVQAVFIDRRGVEVVVTCLVPPFPK